MPTRRKKSCSKSPMTSQPARKKPCQHFSTPESGQSAVDVVTDTFSKLEVTPTNPKRYVSRKKLDFSSPERQPKSHINWSNEEVKGLLTFLMLNSDGSHWIGHKDPSFWGAAGKFIQSQVQSLHCRSVTACQSKTLSVAARFSSPAEASKFYNPDEVTPPLSVPPMSTLSAFEKCKSIIESLPNEEQFSIIVELFQWFDAYQHGQPYFPNDFLEFVFQAAQRLKDSKRENILYLLARGLAILRPDRSDSLIPTTRMPMGLIEYSVAFFNARSVQQIKCPPDYRTWLQTMYVLFGTKWVKCFGGPMWSSEPIMQSLSSSATNTSASTNVLHPSKALVNVPTLSERTIRRDIASTKFTTGSEIQISVLDNAKNSDPEAWWWIKADGVDVVEGLGESVRGDWTGDVDMNDGKLERLKLQYSEQLKLMGSIGLNERSTQPLIIADLENALDVTRRHSEFAIKELERVNRTYETKLSARQSGQKGDSDMFALVWEIEDLRNLIEDIKKVRPNLQSTLEQLKAPSLDMRQNNIPHQLSTIRDTLCRVVKSVFHFKRTAATHMFVVMISSELRNHKPYALPLQCLPCRGLKESDIRRIVLEVVDAMAERDMKVCGFVSNGEYNYLRTRGYNRPVSVFQIRSEARQKYSHSGEKVLLAMLTPKRKPDGTIAAEVVNPAVPAAMLEEIFELQESGYSFVSIIDNLRKRTVPKGYSHSTWIAGRTESFIEKLRSIIAQLEYAYQILKWTSEGVPFQYHFYVPEVLPQTGYTFLEREDEAHVLKRIASQTRSGGPDQLCLERYVEALSDASSGLTQSVLRGARKQSVVDAKRLFGQDLSNFFERKGYNYEATYTTTIMNWRRSCDERGLSELQRCKYNHEFLNLILNELMPWHKDSYDLSLLEVNRSLNGVLGFSRETLAAVTTNIESREWRRRQICEKRPPEHPRSGTSDDVECFFSVLRDTVGKNFSTKQVKFSFRKVTQEFTKRLDDSLPFFYHTSTHTRFCEGELQDFSVKSQKSKRKGSRPPRREQSSAFVSRRATMPIRGSLSVRPKFHNLPVELPPLPSVPIHISEHSYGQQS